MTLVIFHFCSAAAENDISGSEGWNLLVTMALLEMPEIPHHPF